MQTEPVARNILLTARGKAWLAQFELEDQPLAEQLVNRLTLVSHSFFERTMLRLIEHCAAPIDGPIALYAVREVKEGEDYLRPATTNSSQETFRHQGGVDAVGKGAEVGSEGRIASMIRNISRAQPSRFVAHPSIDEMRARRVKAIFVVDDLLGSGHRLRDFLGAIWKSETVRAWHSLHLIKFVVVAYAGTDQGKLRVEATRCNPSVKFAYSCPMFHRMAWAQTARKKLIKLCEKYGRQTSKPALSLGYGGTMAAMVFEHGCPNNAPSILWAPPARKKNWTALFPARTVMSSEASAFPPEVARRDPISLLLDIGQKRLARSGALSRRGVIGDIFLTILALIAKGLRNKSALSHAVGREISDCLRILARCERWGLITANLRITSKGLAELAYARRMHFGPKRPLPRGNDTYYPKQLRRATRG